MNDTHKKIGLLMLLACAAAASGPARADEPEVLARDGRVILRNERVRVILDPATGTYAAEDLRDGSVGLQGASFRVDGYGSDAPGARCSWTTRRVYDGLGKGRTLSVQSTAPERPDLLLEITLYEDTGFLVLCGGVENTLDRTLHVKEIAPLAGARAFPGRDHTRAFSMLDGNGGAEDTAVVHGGSLSCRNDLLVTFREGAARRSLVLGGLTYRAFEKFAAVEGPSREAVLRQEDGAHGPVLRYLDLPTARAGSEADPPFLRLVQGKAFRFRGTNRRWPAACAAVAFHEEAVILEAGGLSPEKRYTLGFSWWDVDGNGRVQSVVVEGAGGKPGPVLLAAHPLPALRKKGEGPERVEIALPPGVYAGGRCRIRFTNEAKAPNAVVSEAWLREGPVRGAPRVRAEPPADASPPPVLALRLFAADPVGKRVDPGVRFLPEDRFYVDFSTRDPFEAMEAYGRRVRIAQDIRLPVYDFPTVCLWYAHHSGYGGGGARNDSAGAVAEMERIAKSGFLEYARAAVRLVPDCYGMNNQQGWWDDEHWQRYGSTNLDMKGPTYVEPYETTEKWGRAVTRLGGIPLTYFQSAFRSEDYAEAFPEQMLFDQARAWKRPGETHAPDETDFWGNAWRRNAALWGYDFTDPDFRRHLRAVYANLREGGVRGLMFDYPATAWASAGGMEDAFATTAAAYRAMFEAARRDLGDPCWIHERNLARGSDVTLGLVASQRIWGDTDRITPVMVTRGGLRWYKNRVVVNYDMDAKNLLRPRTRDARRRLLTMAYVASGRLLLATSFGRMDPETFHDLTRIFPFHAAPRSARPVDAFEQAIPRVYDFPVNEGWHQVTLYNPEDGTPLSVEVNLAAPPAEGGLGLDPDAAYYAYDFWNDRALGLLPGAGRLAAELRPAEARMIALHARERVPQWIATDRHIMQGFVDLEHTAWDEAAGTLSGTARVVGNDPFRIVIALNGYAPVRASASPGGCRAELEAVEGGLVKLRLSSPETVEVRWTVFFGKGGG